MASMKAGAPQPEGQQESIDATREKKNQTPQYIEVDCLKRSDIAAKKKFTNTTRLLQHDKESIPGKSGDSKVARKFTIMESKESFVHEYEEVDSEEVDPEEESVLKTESSKPVSGKVQYENLTIMANEKRGVDLCAKRFGLGLFITLLIISVCGGVAFVSVELFKLKRELSSYQQEKDYTDMQLQGCVEQLNATEFLSQFIHNGTSVFNFLITLYSDIEHLNQSYLSDYASLKQMLALSSNQPTDFTSFSDMNHTLALLEMDFALLNQSFTTIGNLYLQVLHALNNLGQPLTPAASCAALPSGYYGVRASNGSAVRVYCDMTRSCGGVTGGWTRVAYLQFENGSDSCPIGFVERNDSGIRTCGISSTTAACPSILFDTYGIPYSRVCGMVRAYQYGTPDAFARFDGTHRGDTIDSIYVDGVSVTHGSNPRHHIWTFVAAVDEFGRHNYNACPCSNARLSGVSTPAFVGQDYFCDAGTSQRNEFYLFHGDDPLWDGAGCGPHSDCCSFNNPPWFHKQLPQPTTDDIEMRVCCDEDRSNEDIPIAHVEIYVQ